MNSFFMLFFDNFSSLLGILAGMISCPAIATSFSNPEANFTDAEGNPMAADDGNYYTRGEYDDAFFKMVFTQVCPGIGCALLFGNIWYAMMAAKLSTTTGREDHTALPYGSAVWSRRPVDVESFAAIIMYQMLPKRRAHPMPGHTCENTIVLNAAK